MIFSEQLAKYLDLIGIYKYLIQNEQEKATSELYNVNSLMNSKNMRKLVYFYKLINFGISSLNFIYSKIP